MLPQTQCTRCGYPDCQRYAEAIARGDAGIDQCPPGGAEGIRRLAALTGRPVVPLNPTHGQEGPLRRALIDEAWCIGCTLCIKACPVDCILGAPKRMHTVVTDACTGCELCLPACPVDCITLVVDDPSRTGREAWSEEAARMAKVAYLERTSRLERDTTEQAARLQAQVEHKLADRLAANRPDDDHAVARRQAVIQAALERARTAQVGKTRADEAQASEAQAGKARGGTGA